MSRASNLQREEAAEFFNRTTAGGVITLVSGLFMALLFLSELREWAAQKASKRASTLHRQNSIPGSWAQRPMARQWVSGRAAALPRCIVSRLLSMGVRRHCRAVHAGDDGERAECGHKQRGDARHPRAPRAAGLRSEGWLHIRKAGGSALIPGCPCMPLAAAGAVLLCRWVPAPATAPLARSLVRRGGAAPAPPGRPSPGPPLPAHPTV